MEQLLKFLQVSPGKRTYRELREEGAPSLGKEIYLPMLELKADTISLFDPQKKQINFKANKFLARQYTRMARALDEGNLEKYGAIAKGLHDRSIAYRVAILNKVYKEGMVEMDQWQLMKYLNVKGPKGNQFTNVKYTRFYIDKPNGDKRPIGAPEFITKVYQTSQNFMLINVVDRKMDDYQHGYRPKKGFGTAMVDIIKKSANAHRMVEFDLTKCFNNINLETMGQALREYGVPEEMIENITVNNKVKPMYELLEDEKDPELGDENVYIGEGGGNKIHGRYNVFADGTPAKPNDKYGFTQGSPLAPTLAIATLDLVYRREIRDNPDVDITMYADDGIIYVYNPEPAKDENMKEALTNPEHPMHEYAMEGHHKLWSNRDNKDFSRSPSFRRAGKRYKVDHLSQPVGLINKPGFGIEVNGKKSNWIYDKFKFLGVEVNLKEQRIGSFSFESILENPEKLNKIYSYAEKQKQPDIKPIVLKNDKAFAYQILPDSVDPYELYWVGKKGPEPILIEHEKHGVDTEAIWTVLVRKGRESRGYGMYVMGLKQDLSSYATACLLELHRELKKERLAEKPGNKVKITRYATWDNRGNRYNKDGLTAKGRRTIERGYEKVMKDRNVIKPEMANLDKLYEYLEKTDQTKEE